MKDHIVIDRKTYISSSRAAEISKYSKDYVGQLCRGQKIDARIVGRNWYVDEESLLAYKKASEESLEARFKQYSENATSQKNVENSIATPVASNNSEIIKTDVPIPPQISDLAVSAVPSTIIPPIVWQQQYHEMPLEAKPESIKIPEIKWKTEYFADNRPLLPELNKSGVSQVSDISSNAILDNYLSATSKGVISSTSPLSNVVSPFFSRIRAIATTVTVLTVVVTGSAFAMYANDNIRVAVRSTGETAVRFFETSPIPDVIPRNTASIGDTLSYIGSLFKSAQEGLVIVLSDLFGNSDLAQNIVPIKTRTTNKPYFVYYPYYSATSTANNSSLAKNASTTDRLNTTDDSRAIDGQGGRLAVVNQNPTNVTNNTIIQSSTLAAIDAALTRRVSNVEDQISFISNSILDKDQIIQIIGRSISNSFFRGFGSGGNTTIINSTGGSGTVTSISADGGTTGLSFSGGPITTSGTLSLGGVLNEANGGTGLSTAPSYGQVLLGNTSGGYDLVATSSLGIVGGVGGGSGTVTSVDVSGGTTGLTFTGGPVSTSGVLTMSGILDTTNGGTGWSNIESGSILYGDGTNTLATTTAGAAGQVLALLNGVPTWTSTTTFAGGLSYLNGVASLDTSASNIWTTASTTFVGGVTMGTATTTSATTTNLSIAGTIRGAGLTSCSGSSSKLLWNVTTGQFSCGADAGAGGGITALGAEYSTYQTGSTQTLATSTSLDDNISLSITSAGDTQTFTPAWTGILAAGRGGTGVGTPAANQILIGNSTGTGWTQMATATMGFITTNVSEGTNLYYRDDRVNTYLAASTTLAKTYSANTFTGLNTFNGGITIGTLNGPLQANNGVVSATTSIGTIYGGTGLSTAPSYGQVLLGNIAGGYTLSATSTLGFLASSSVASLLTNFLPLWTGASFGNSIISASSTAIGIGTTSPSAGLAIHALNGSGFPTLFLIASSTANSTTTLFSISNTGVASTTNLIVSGLGGATQRCLQVGPDGTLTATTAACIVGSISGNISWATTTSPVAGVNINYSSNYGDVIAIGSNSTTTSKFWFDPNTSAAYLSGQLKLAYDASNYVNTSVSSAGAVTMNIAGSQGGLTINNPQAPTTAGQFGNNAVTSLTVTGATGGNTTYTGGAAFAGTGGGINLYGGVGGSASGASVSATAASGAGGNVSIVSGQGGDVSNGATNASAGPGGSLVLAGGAGGAAGGSGNSVGGAGGSVYLYPGLGGTGATTNGSIGSLFLGTDGANNLGKIFLGLSSVYDAASSILGIGTTTPAWTLDVASSTPYIALTDTNAGTNLKHWFLTNTDGQFSIGTSSDALNSTSSVLSINSSGIVRASSGLSVGSLNGILQGINGAVSASSTLSVAYGGTGLSSLPSYGQLLLGNASGGYTLVATSSLGLPGNDWRIVAGSYLAPTTTLGILVNASSTIGSGTQAGGLTISGGATTTGNAFFNGNVGVGTTSPWGRLSVTSSGATSATYGLVVADSNNSPKMVVRDDGNVGIGTINPSFKLSLGTTLTNTALALYDDGSSSMGMGAQSGLLRFNLYAGAGQRYGFFDGTTKELMSIRDTGEVGIGSTTPWAKFSIANHGGTNPLFVIASSSDTVATTTHLIVNSIGNVGIGTTTPDALLYVQGTRDNKQFTVRENSSQTANLAEFLESNGNIIARINKTSMPFEVNAYQVDPNTNIIPIMTGATTPSGVASANLTFSGSNAWEAFDGILGINHEDSWLSSATTGILTYQFPGSRVVGKYSVTSLPLGAYALKNWTFEGSNNGSSWTVLDTQTNVTDWTLTNTYTFTNTTAYTYYRINITASNDANYAGVGRLQMFESATIPSSALAVTPTGQIGLNNSSPGAQLHVIANAATTKGLIVQGYSGQTSNLQEWKDGSAVSVSVVTADGRIGIGTSSPFTTLSVAGIGSFDNYVRSSYFTATSTTIASTFPYASTTMLTASGGIMSMASTTIGSGTQAGGLTIFGGATTTGNAYFNGNVGIGTTTMSEKLTIEGNIAPSMTNSYTLGSFTLNSAVASAANITISGIADSNVLGSSVASAGDVNGDGINDVIVGAKWAAGGGTQRGQAYIFFGSTTPLTTFSASSANVTISGIADSDNFGVGISSAGDVNGDGYSDVIIGAPNVANGGSYRGQAYIFYGGPTLLGSKIASSANVIISGIADFDMLGASVAAAGDVNGDSYSDVIVGSSGAAGGGTGRGQAYIFYGSRNFSGSKISSSANVIISGIANNNALGQSVASAGDVNGDGYSDVIVGAGGAAGGGTSRGQAYIFYGGPTFSGSKVASSANVTISGIVDSDQLGNSVASAGDVNGDGYADVIIGATAADLGGTIRGQAYIFHGGPTFSGSKIASSANVIISGIVDYDAFGWGVASAGDVNGDGYSDVIVGGQYSDFGNVRLGQVHIFYGGSNFSGSKVSSSANVIYSGIASSYGFGYGVASAGDFNSDGYADVIVGDPSADAGGSWRGQAYIFTPTGNRWKSIYSQSGSFTKGIQVNGGGTTLSGYGLTSNNPFSLNTSDWSISKTGSAFLQNVAVSNFLSIGTTTAASSTLSSMLSILGFGQNDLLNIASSSGASLLSLKANGNLGIGTSSPYAALSVAGRGVFNQDVRANYFTATSTTIASTFPYASTTMLTASGGIMSMASTTIGSGTQAGGLTIFGGATTTGNAYFNGNVGIGTTSPYAPLSVRSTSLATTTFAISPTSEQYGNILDIYNTFGSLTSVINADGNWGLGTSSPNAKLDIQTGNLSSKGELWTARTASVAGYWKSVAYGGNGRWVAVGSSGDCDDTVMLSTDNGASWSTQTIAAGICALSSVTYGNGLFVAVDAETTNPNIMTSPDGIVWTGRSVSGIDNSWKSVTYGNGTFVAVGDGGSQSVMTSNNGIDWTPRSASASSAWESVTYGNGIFVAVASVGANRVMISTNNGASWTNQTAAEANYWDSVTYGEGLFVAVAMTGSNRVMTSPNGITWTPRSATEANLWLSVTYGNGVFVAVSGDGTNRVMTSPDGITWTPYSAAAANTWSGIGYGDGIFVGVAIDGANQVMTSDRVNSYPLLKVGNNALIVNNKGNVGVGTSTPNWSLQIASSTPYFAITNTGAGLDSKHWLMSNIDGTFRIGTSSDALNSTSTYLTIDVAGNVTIANNLNITGVTNLIGGFISSASSTLQNFTALNSTTTNATTTNFFATTASSTNLFSSLLTVGSNALVVGSVGNVGVGTTSPWGRLSVTGSGATSATYGLVVADSNNSPKMVVRDDGNVGIGTSTPQSLLTINTGTFNASVLSINNSYNQASNRNWAIALNQSEYGDFHIMQGSAQNSPAISGTSRFVIENTGNVGIGSSTPWAKFSIANHGGTNPLFVIASSSDAVATTTHLIVNSVGNVGIGTTNPTIGRLQVTQSSATQISSWSANSSALGYINTPVWQGQGFAFSAGSDNDAFSMVYNGTSAYFGQLSGASRTEWMHFDNSAIVSGDSNFQIGRNSNNTYFAANSGNVGIGSSTPWAKFSIANHGGTNPLFVIASSSDAVATTTHLIVNSVGNVGIGTTTVPEKLTIEGNIAPSMTNSYTVGSFTLNSAVASTANITISGITNSDNLGQSVASAGDVNGDGINDVIVGAPGSDVAGTGYGQAYIFFGSTTPRTTFNPSSADVTISGAVDSVALGSMVAGVGDMNGDGYADVMVGTYLFFGGTGKVFIFYGGPSLSGSKTVSSANVTISADTTDDYFGEKAAGAGDVNGDGYADVIVGAYGASGGGSFRGQAYIFYGGSSFSGSKVASSANVIFSGIADSNQLGTSVASAGDVNGDGYDDVIVGASGAAGGGSQRGEAYIFYGAPNLSGSYIASTANVTISGIANSDNLGVSAASAGDMNGDGYADVIVGASNAAGGGTNRGQAYIFYGSRNLSGSKVASTANVIISGIADYDYAGASVAPVGDVNGDGYTDVIVGAYNAAGGGTNRGQAYIFYGNPNFSGSKVASSTNVIFSGIADYNSFGFSVASAGDINADGYPDVMVGAYMAAGGGTQRGQAYIFTPTGNRFKSIYSQSGSFTKGIQVNGGGTTLSGYGLTTNNPFSLNTSDWSISKTGSAFLQNVAVSNFLSIGTTTAASSTLSSMLSILGFGQNDLLNIASSSGASLLSLKANGNLGIGTSSPFTTLSVAGIGSFDNYVRSSYFTATSTTIASNFPYASTTMLTASGGIMSMASTTIGSGTQAGGLTIFGGATTTGNAFFNGNVGIGSTSPWQNLSVVGGVALDGLAAASSGNLTVCINNATKLIYQGGSASSCDTSSIRYKHDVVSFDGGLSELMKFNPVSYFYNTGDTRQHLGFIAEEVNAVDPRLVEFDDEGLPNALRTDQFLPVITKSIQQMIGAIDIRDAIATGTAPTLVSHYAALSTSGNSDASGASTTPAAITIDNMGNVAFVGSITAKNITGTIAGVDAISQSLQTLANKVDLLAQTGTSTSSSDLSVASTTTATSTIPTMLDFLAIQTEHGQKIQTIQLDIMAIHSRLESLASTTASLSLLSANLTDAVASLNAASSTLVASTSEALATSTPFIQSVANAVEVMLRSTGNWMMDKITARIVYADRIEAKTVAVTQGMEMTDQSTGQIYCVVIKNGDWNKTVGACAGGAAGTPGAVPAETVLVSPTLAVPVVTAPTGTPVPVPPVVTTTSPVVATSTSPVVDEPTSPVATSTSPVVVPPSSPTTDTVPAAGAAGADEPTSGTTPTPTTSPTTTIEPVAPVTAPVVAPVTPPVSAPIVEVPAPADAPVTVSDTAPAL